MGPPRDWQSTESDTLSPILGSMVENTVIYCVKVISSEFKLFTPSRIQCEVFAIWGPPREWQRTSIGTPSIILGSMVGNTLIYCITMISNEFKLFTL